MREARKAELEAPTFLDPEVVECPFPVYDRLLEESPVYRDPATGFYIVSRYDDVRRVLTDPDGFVSGGIVEHVRDGVLAERADRMRAVYVEKGWLPGPSLSQQDEPRHSQTRAIFDQAFRAGKVKELDPLVRDTAYRLIDGFIGDGRCEFVSQFAVPLPLTIIAVQMGARPEDVPTIKRWTDLWVKRLGLLQSEEEELACVEAEIESQHYFKAIFDAKRRAPDETLISELVNTPTSEGRTLTDNELFAHIMADTFVGGSETSTNALSAGMMLLARNPDQHALLKSDPEKYLRRFCEEVLRLESPVQLLFRIAARDVEIAGTTIPSGSIVGVAYGAANRDPRHFECPAQLDLTRGNAGSHMAFGSGIHHCLGAPLARRELYWGFRAVIERLDDIRLAPDNDFAHQPNIMLRMLKRLNVTFTPRGNDA